MLPPYVTIHRRALTAFDVLKRTEQKRVAAKFRALHALPPERWEEESARLLRPDPVTYLVEVTPDLLAFFSPQPGGGLLIEDFVRPGALKQFAAASGTANGKA